MHVLPSSINKTSLFSCIVIVLGLHIFFPNHVFSEELTASLYKEDTFNESFDSTSPVSGIPLAGLTIGERQEHLNINHVSIAAPPQQNRLACIIGRTRDGRYYSENLYKVPSITPQNNSAKVQPITKGFDTALAKYPSKNYALIGRLATNNSCEGATDYYLPRIDDKESSILSININSGGGSPFVTASIELFDSKQNTTARRQQETFHCTPLTDDVNIAYDTKCILDVAAFMGNLCNIKVSFDNGISIRDQSYHIYLPKGPIN